MVCRGLLDGYHQASCQMCSGRFHQPWDVAVQVPQCAQITTHEEALALVFLCKMCYQSKLTGTGERGTVHVDPLGPVKVTGSD